MDGPDSRARRAVERIEDPVVALDVGWNVTYLNRAAHEVFDVRVGDSLPDALPNAAADRLRKRCTASLRTGEPLSFDLALDDRYAVRTHPEADELTLSFRVSDTPAGASADVAAEFVGFQTDVTERKRAERQARQRAADLEHLLARIEGLLSDVTTGVVEANTRTEIEAVVCEELAAVEPYDLAWVGERDVRTDEVTVREKAGTGDPEMDAPVVVRAFDSDGLQVSDDGRTAAMALAAEDAEYGVLVVHGPGRDACDERERVVLGSLGRAITSAINARETRRILVADSVVEAEFGFDDPDLSFVGVTRGTGASLTYRGSVQRDDGALVALCTVADADPETVVEAAASHDYVDDAILVAEHDGEALVEFVLGSGSVVGTMSDYGGKTQSITADDGDGRMVVEFPQSADVRTLVGRLQERYPGTELLALRHRERPARTKQEFLASLSDELTDRQLAALQKAFVGGFFDWPRPVTGDELADTMGISRSTFHEHLRAAQRKLCAEFFGERAE